MRYSRKSANGIHAFRRRAAALAIGSLLASAGTAGAFEIDTGNPDLSLRWDNTIRYNLGYRAQSQDPAILGNPNFDDGDRNFSKNSAILKWASLRQRLSGRLVASRIAHAVFQAPGSSRASCSA